MKKKEEFPTFLNEQPTIIFGRTGRELMIMACGLAAAYTIWGDMHKHGSGPSWVILTVVLAVLPVLLSVVIALVSIAGKPLEEWSIIWLLYLVTPKLYLYILPDEDEEGSERTEEEAREQQLQLSVQSDGEEDD